MKLLGSRLDSIPPILFALCLGSACTTDAADAGDGNGDGPDAGDMVGSTDGGNGNGGGGGDAGAGGGDCSVPVMLESATCAQVNSFIDVSKSCGAGASYATPSLSASCTTDAVEVTSNGIPNFNFVPMTPNALTTQSITWRFPRTPTRATTPGDIPLGGPSALAVNGLPIFGPTEAPTHGYRDPVLDELLDYCAGHTAPGGVYHFHARPDCMFQDAAGNPYLILGWSLDGYPILAPYMCEDAACSSVKKVKSSWRQLEETYGTTIENAWDAHEYVQGLGDLDECNGATLPDGNYAYFATDSFPYFMGCYRGNKTGTVSGLGGPGGPGGM